MILLKRINPSGFRTIFRALVFSLMWSSPETSVYDKGVKCK
jgi:hypothetical protein